MTSRIQTKALARQSQQTIGNVMIAIPDLRSRPPPPAQRFSRVSVQHVNNSSKPPSRFFDEYVAVEREKAAQTGRWILNVIAAQESYQQGTLNSTNSRYTDSRGPPQKKYSFQSRRFSKVEPLENSSTQFTHSHFHSTQTKLNRQQQQNTNRVSRDVKLTPATVDRNSATPLSSFSSATSVDDIRTTEDSSHSLQTKRDDDFTDEFEDENERTCISKRMMIIFSVISVIIIVAVLIAVLVVVFVGRNS